MIGKIDKWKNLVFFGVIMMTTANAANEPLKIRSVFDINYAFCAIKTNGVLGMDNRDSAVSGRGFGSSSTNAMLVLANGENDITLEIGALGWFSEEKLTDEERKKFHPESSCKLDLTAFKSKESKVLSRIHVGINKDGIPFVKSDEEKISANPERIIIKKISAQKIEKGHIPDNYFIDNYFPDGMDLYQFTQKVYLKGLPEWTWTRATPFTGTSEQVQALKLVYLDLWHLFVAKDNEKIKLYLNESLHAWSITTGENINDIYNDNDFVNDFKHPDFHMIPINWNDYKIEVMNKGRMVRFVNKSDPTVYPISYSVKDDDGDNNLGYFSPVFSLIDGRFIPVI
ncbi:hypothetical protein B4923_19575 [Brenneria roseae subsp. americana]|uniref:Uncharacterized protein n=1 Tax=Brenneria roseae subsp. americana TaxID=1508507 RepID=A0A2U1TJA8_9GAMM|nr:hypothetical protein [Brenneria roseae]PWC09494.1 hypothetical protein B4923_19575 [Brenneria roseae subsp. americana]